MATTFSVIIPTYNRATLIEKTIRSVLNQTFDDFEIIIIDDGSIDNTEEIVAAVKSEKIIYQKKKNEERAVARNTGTKMAKGNYITFLDSDDLFYQNHLQIAFENIQKNKQPEIFHTRYEIISEENKILEQKNILDNHINQKLIEGNFMSCNGVFLRNDIAKQNLFNEDRNISALEDWELWLRIASQYKISYSNVITSAIVNHDSRSVLNTKKEELVNRFTIFMQYVLNNKTIVDYYKKNIFKFKSSCYSYISLHLALTKKYKKDSLVYLLKAIKENKSFVFSRRFLAIVKHLF